jgi:hypothetical protein
MSDVRIHLYALCWNEARMLPFFFRHYDPIVDRYFIFDSGSTDGSRTMLGGHPKVTLKYAQVNGPSFALAARNFYNSCWKASRGQADWVVVCNIDEHLHHEDLRGYLAECRDHGYSLIMPEGYEMVSAEFPTDDRPLCQQVRTGVRSVSFDKPQLFQPDAIEEINFVPGRHTAKPRGRVRRPPQPQVKLLHYKLLGADYFRTRLAELRVGLRDLDVANKWGCQYLWDDQQKAEHFRRLLEASVQVL